MASNTDKYVVGFVLSTNTNLWIQGDHYPDFAKDIAESLRLRYKSDIRLERFHYLLIADLFYNEDGDSIITTGPMWPYSKHTVHEIDTINGQVRLFDPQTKVMKVSFSFPTFIKRYYPDYNG